MKTRFAKRARDYMRSEQAYLRKYSPSAARTFIAQIQTARDNLARFPELGTLIAQGGGPGLRQLVVHDYLIQYAILHEELLILAIRHAKQMPEDEESTGLGDYEG